MPDALALDSEGRTLLFAIARFPAGRILQPYQVTPAQRLECMGLVSVRLTALSVFLGAYCYRPCEAVVTAAGRRVVEGPALVRLRGVPIDPVIAPRLRLPETFDPPRDRDGHPLPRHPGGI
jgi:hypothetical protein